MKRLQGYSLVELVLAIGIFGMVASSLVFFSVNVFGSLNNFEQRVSSDIIRDQLFEQFAVIKKGSWGDILLNTKDTLMHIEQNGHGLIIVDGQVVSGDLTYGFTIKEVFRDAQGNIAETGTIDPHSRKIDISFSWVNPVGVTEVYDTYFYVNDWNTYKWIQTLVAEFSLGSLNDTIIVNNGDGEVELGTMVYSDWCKPQNTYYSFDLTGQGIATTISSEPGKAFVGTGANASGLSFIRADITHTETPTMQIHGTFNGYKVNDSFGLANYAFLATDTNSKEMVILDISATPYTEVGYFDSPGSADANSVVVNDNLGFLAVGNNVYIINLSSKSGARAQIGSAIDIGGQVMYLSISGNYLYVANSSTTQLKVIDFTTPASASIVATASVNGLGGTGIWADDTRAYLSTAVSATLNELFIINVSTKSGSLPVIGNVDSSGMNPKSVVKVDEGRVIVVGTGGNEYQVFNTENEANPALCGQLNIDTGVNDATGVILANGDTYSYIVTGDSSGELKIIKGGAGGGGADGRGHAPSGTFTSSIFDTGSESASYLYISWDQVVPAGCNLSFQVRASTASDMSGSTFVGSDNTSGTYFTNNIGSYVPIELAMKRYFQYKAFFTSDTVCTATLSSVTVNYAK